MHSTRLPRASSLFTLIVAGVLGGAVSSAQAAYRLADVTVVCPAGAPETTRIAADEIRRYVYLLTGKLPTLGETSSQRPPQGAAGTDKPDAAAATGKQPSIVVRTATGGKVPAGGRNPSQNSALYADGNAQVVEGASPAATLWAAYQLIESWGVGFYLGGDALPPVDARKEVELVEATAQPTLTIRGSLPWFNFMNSPTTWNPQDYKMFFAQMAKQRANLIGFHVYDHEPFCGYDFSTLNTGTYLGRPDVAASGGPLMTTTSPQRWWSPAAMATSDFLFGTDLFFNRGEWGCEVGIDDAWAYNPARATQLQQQMMAEAFRYAQTIGLRTCIGFEVHDNPLDPKVRAAFRRKLEHTVRTYPLDYVWIWQAEGRGTAGNARNWVAGKPNDATIKSDEQIAQAFAYLGPQQDLREAARITNYVLLARETLAELAPRARLVVSGWGGDAWMKFSSLYEGLDKVVPPDVIFAALDNIDPRLEDHVSNAYGRLQPARERWPIPWFESDGGHARIDQTGPSTNVTAFEPLLSDIVKKNCQGALGIHWRSRNIEDVAGYLYRFGWNSKLTAAEFLKQYARDHYGSDDAEYMAKVHLRLEELGPQYVGAVGTVECSTPFTWFVKSGGADKGREPNRAGHLPDESRFPELEKLAADLMERSKKAAADGRQHASMQYHDLSQTITWLVIRAKVGLAIWNDDAPLAKRLIEAEGMFDRGEKEKAGAAARGVLKDLEALDFRTALGALASTCRTRGELGMLATADSRYGRFYAAIVQRIARLTGEPLTAVRGSGDWKGERLTTLFPVPGEIPLGTAVNFDAVVLPPTTEACQVEISLAPNRAAAPDGAGSAKPASAVVQRLERLGGQYHRAGFEPREPGTYVWKLSTGASEPAASGILVVRPSGESQTR